MSNNNRLLLWGSVAIGVLAAVIVILFINLSSGKENEGFIVGEGGISVYNGIPSDAVVVLDFKALNEYRPLLQDSVSFAYKLLDSSNGLVNFQEQLLGIEELSSVPFVYSLHYSSKNSVSFLQVADLSGADNTVMDRLFAGADKEKRYNGVAISSLPSGIVVAIHKNLLLASSSSYVLESSIRHLENNTSILDNEIFGKLLERYGGKSGIYVNHNQIGKLFSGIVARRYLGYSDFMMEFTSWSRYGLKMESGKLFLTGSFENDGDEWRFSNVISSQSSRRSFMGKILPASAVFAVSLPMEDVQEFLRAHNLHLEMQKKGGKFAYKQKIAQGESKVSPRKWVDSLEIEELVSAYCKFGEKCEWLTLIRKKGQFGLNNVISAVVDGDKVEAPQPFAHKGYIASVFGDLFAHCNEEAIYKAGEWSIIGPSKILEEFSNGNANYFNLEHYLSQTPAHNYLSSDAAVKIVANLKEAGDSVLQIFKPYPAECLQNQMSRNNFEYLTMDIKKGDGGAVADIALYATVLEQLPVAKEREEDAVVNFVVDSTIAVPQGPFEVYDVTKKANAYLEQLPNMRLRYMDANRKGVWAIPFDTPVCGFVEQIDLYGNGRLQMLFAAANKMYLLDRLGRFVYGYPVKLPKGVVLGPKLIKGEKGMDYSVLCLNDDNSIAWYDVSGKSVEGWSDIVAPEFVKELPELVELGSGKYWVLRAPSQLLLYTLDGKRIEMADGRKKIDRDSDVEFVQSGVFRVRCTDGKMYNWNLETGKLKKWNN